MTRSGRWPKTRKAMCARGRSFAVKFSDIRESDWPQLAPWMDTCLLPVTGLAGTEAPHEAARRLEKLRDLLDLVEKPYRGRVVTYPAFQYLTSADLAAELDR